MINVAKYMWEAHIFTEQKSNKRWESYETFGKRDFYFKKYKR